MICYDEHGMASSVARVLKSLGSNCTTEALNRTINRTVRPGHHNASSDVIADSEAQGSLVHSNRLLPNQSAWVASQYWDDVVLYRALCEPRLPHLKEPKHHLPTDLRWLPGIVHGQPFDPQRRGMNGWFNDFGDLIKELTAKTKSKTK